jgi:hypothetical protein
LFRIIVKNHYPQKPLYLFPLAGLNLSICSLRSFMQSNRSGSYLTKNCENP